MRAISIAKFEENSLNEDAALVKQEMIAVSDGAGGGGLFADRWSKYLVEHLPEDPIIDFESFDAWIDGIWEYFYNECEREATQEGGILLNKFYDEGAFATVVAVWKNGQWISYGDSVAFCYDCKTGILQHSFGRLSDFNNPPFLVNCKDPLIENGFRCGRFELNDDCMVFAASDALAHYILMMYEVNHADRYDAELQEAVNAQTKDSNFIRMAMGIKKKDFYQDVIRKLSNCRNQTNFMRHLTKLRKMGLIAHDDYSLAMM